MCIKASEVEEIEGKALCFRKPDFASHLNKAGIWVTTRRSFEWQRMQKLFIIEFFGEYRKGIST